MCPWTDQSPDELPSGPVLAIHEQATPRSPISVYEYFKMHFIGALFPVAAGISFYGFRASLSIACVMISAILGMLIWRQIGRRGRQLRLIHTLWLSLLLAMMIPPHLATLSAPGGAVWAVLPGAGLLLAMLIWVLGGIGSGRVHPVLVSYLLLSVCFSRLLSPQSVLDRHRLVMGDVLDYDSTMLIVQSESWLERAPSASHPATRSEPPGEALVNYTQGQPSPDRAVLSLQSLVRDDLPPLEDLIAGAIPGPIGASCGIAVFIGGLFLVYRGLIDWRIPLLILISSFIAMLIFPVPEVIREHPQFAWMPWQHKHVGWALGITFASYELFAGPMLFVAFFLATSPSIRPMSRPTRLVYAICVGVLSAAFQLYVSVAIGPYVALLLISLMTPTFDRWLRAKPLV